MTAAMPLRVVEGASKFIEGASLYKIFTIGLSPVRKQASLASLEEMHSPFGGWRHHLSPAERWDYGYLAMEPCLCRKA